MRKLKGRHLCCRKEIGGSIWQHGGEGKITKYKSSRDLQDPYGLGSDKSNGSTTPDNRPVSLKSTRSKASSRSTPGADRSPIKVDTGSQHGQGYSQGQSQRKLSVKSKNATKSVAKGKFQANSQVPSLSITGMGGNPNKAQFVDELFIIESVSMANTQGQRVTAAGSGLKDKVSGANNNPSKTEDDVSVMPSNLGTEADDLKAVEKRKRALAKMMQKLSYEDELEEYKKPASVEFGDHAEQQKGDEQAQLTELHDHHMVTKPPGVQPCDPAVKHWLKSLHLLDTDTLVKRFAQHGIDMDVVPQLTKEKLRQMNVKNVGVQNKIMSGVDTLIRRNRARSRPGSVKAPVILNTDTLAVERPTHIGVTVEPSQKCSQNTTKGTSVSHRIPTQYSLTKGASSLEKNSKDSLKTKQSGVSRTVTSKMVKTGSSSSFNKPVSMTTRPASAKEVTQRKVTNPRPRPFSASIALNRDSHQDRPINKQALSITSPSGKAKHVSPRLTEHMSEVSSGGSSSRSGQGSARSPRSSGRSPRVVRNNFS